MRSKENQRSIARQRDHKCRYQSASRKDLVKSRRTGAMLLKKLFQYANKLPSAEPLVFNVLNSSSNLSSMFVQLIYWLAVFTWFWLGPCIIITSSSILLNSSENTSPSEECKKEYTWSWSMTSAIRDIALLPRI